MTLINNHGFWLDVTNDSRAVKGLANGGWYAPALCPAGQPGCESNPSWDPSEAYYDPVEQRFFFTCRFVYEDDDGVLQQPACDIWVGSRSDTIVVHTVGVFYQDDAEVDPQEVGLGFRAITKPPSSADTSGMVIVSYNQMKGSRPNPDTQDYGPPPEERDMTPNLLAHELLHAVGGPEMVHTNPDSEVPDRLLVGRDIDSCDAMSDPAACRGGGVQKGISDGST